MGLRVLAAVAVFLCGLQLALTLPSCVDCPQYVALSARDKAAVLWGKIKASEYQSFPNDWYGLSMAELLTEDMNEPFDRFSDQLPADRKKLIHTFGSIAQVKFVAESNKYSGVFQGAQYGFARLSLAKKPPAFTPGMAVKFLRDNTYSANIISMFELSGQDTDYNFFKNEFKTWVNQGSGVVLELGGKVFEKGSSTPTHLSVDNLGIAGQDGKTVSDGEFAYPGQLYFVPSPALAQRFSSAEHEYRHDLKSLPAGTTLYEVWAADHCTCGGDDKPCQHVKDCDHKHKIGSLVTTSGFVASKWGDSSMFFQHYRFGKKGRRTCSYKDTLASDTPSRLSGNLREQCVTTSCPEIGGYLGGWLFGLGSTKATSSKDGCAWGMNSKESAWLAEPMTEDANVNSHSSVVPALVGSAAVLAVIAIGVAVYRNRRSRTYVEMEASSL